MKIALAASEAAPYAKSGGLGDVMQALPLELSRIEGNEVILILPYYRKVKDNPTYPTELVSEIMVNLGWRQQYAGVRRLVTAEPGPAVYFIDNEYYFGRSGNFYGHMDDGERFAFFSKAVLDALCVLDFSPDVIQCNDWQTALVPVYCKAMYGRRFAETKCVFTIHNVEYQGWANAEFFDDVLGLPGNWRGIMTFDNSVNLMKGAIEAADMVTTVSETYAKELLYPYYAHGLDGILQRNAGKLFGITNGIDPDVFDPSKDKALPANYNADTFAEGKAKCKTALQKDLGLPQRADVPMMAMITRLVGHKGIALVCYAAERLMQQDVQLVIIGTGEHHYEEFFRELERRYPDKVSAQITFNLRLAARLYASADIYLMPSKSEPCGLSQLNAMRYGTVPVVNATGGLKDTVPAYNPVENTGLGFNFQSYNGDDFYDAVNRCLRLYWDDPQGWKELVHRDMIQDFSWRIPAGKYMDLFRKVLSW